MTDQEKVEKMFEIRMTDKRIKGMLSPVFGAYWGLLNMYNDRFKDGQGTLF